MGMPEEPYIWLIVETYEEWGSGIRGGRHVRPVPGQEVPTTYRVRFPKAPRFAYKLGQKFRVPAKITDKDGGNRFVHTNHAWDYEVVRD